MTKLYRKIERKGVIEFKEVDVPFKLTEEFKTFILKDELINKLALYLATSQSGKSYKVLANEIVNQIFLEGETSG